MVESSGDIFDYKFLIKSISLLLAISNKLLKFNMPGSKPSYILITVLRSGNLFDSNSVGLQVCNSGQILLIKLM